MSQYLALAVCIVATALAGCSAGTVSTSVGPGHPANANAAQSMFELTPTRSPEPVTSTTDADSTHHAVPPAGDAAESGLGRLMNSYLAIGAALASDTLDGAPQAAAALANAIRSMSSTPNPDDPHFWHMRREQIKAIQTRSAEVGAASEIRDARVAFGHLSVAVNDVVSALGLPPDIGEPVNGFVCGMFRDAPQGGLWLQRGADARNPYFGGAMSSCNSKTFDVPTTAMAMSGHSDE